MSEWVKETAMEWKLLSEPLMPAKDKLVEDLGCEIQKSKPAFVFFIQRWSQERYKGELRNSWLKAARKKEENVKAKQHFADGPKICKHL